MSDDSTKVNDVTEAKHPNKADDHVVEVHVTHINETEKTSFKEKESATLDQVWSQAYGKFDPKIERKPKDTFQTGGVGEPKSLMGHLSLTLKQAHETKLIHSYHFAIASETGGA